YRALGGAISKEVGCCSTTTSSRVSCQRSRRMGPRVLLFLPRATRACTLLRFNTQISVRPIGTRSSRQPQIAHSFGSTTRSLLVHRSCRLRPNSRRSKTFGDFHLQASWSPSLHFRGLRRRLSSVAQALIPAKSTS